MSAICGYWVLRGDKSPQPPCAAMLQALSPHGPDGSSQQGAREVAIGHRLLKITAEDSRERQPVLLDPNRRETVNSEANSPHLFRGRVRDTEADIWLVADARINNRADLAAELNLAPKEWVTMPDSAFVGLAWGRWGEECMQHLQGAFAFAVWDARAQQFFLARDHAGERPLYYRKAAGFFTFATTARAIRACPDVSSELDARQLARDLMGLPPEPPQTRFREVQALPPGHCAVVSRQSLVARRYWRIWPVAPVRFPRDQDYVEAFLEIFDEAVRCRLRTTGTIATELSSGLDSGSVAATAARLLAQQGGSLTAYTAVPCPDFSGRVPRGLIGDEGRGAAEVAALHPNLRHVRMDPSGSDMLRELERIFPLLDLPHAAALNNVWGNLILDHARANGVKVMLAGSLGNFAVSYSGADLLRASFVGGHWLQAVGQVCKLRRMGLSSGRDAVSQWFSSWLPWAVRCRLDPRVLTAKISWAGLRTDWSPESGALELRAMASGARELSALDQYRRHLYESSTPLPRVMEMQFQTNQYGDYNAATAAGWGIEVRDPTADKRLFDFCATIPQEQFVVGGQARSLIRRAMRGRLPLATLNRREKGTQAADWYECLSKIQVELKAEVARLQCSPVARRLIDLELLRDALETWPSTALEASQRPGVYEATLPRALAVGSFIRRIEAEAAQVQAGEWAVA